jgi:hypothetical protein
MEFYTFRGILDDIGTLQSNSTFSTVSQSFTQDTGLGIGREFNNGVIAGGHRDHATTNSSSRTTQNTVLTLSFLKTGDKTHYEVTIPKMAMFEILRKGDEIGIILMNNNIVTVKNFTSGMKIQSPIHHELIPSLYSYFFAPNSGIMLGSLVDGLWFFLMISTVSFADSYFFIFLMLCLIVVFLCEFIPLLLRQ